MTKKQKRALKFLENDHGPYTVEPLEDHPLAQELGLDDNQVIARFRRHRFVVEKDGGIIPVPVPKEE